MQSLLEHASFAPHGYCLLWNPWLIALHVGADLLIAFSYFAIPGALFVFLRRRPDLRHRRLVALFAAFILLCGLTHLVSLVTLWLPVYTAEGLLKLATGIVSATTAVVLFRLIPLLVAIPSPHDLERQVEERTRALSEATQRLSVLSREAVHRGRNLLTVVASIARQTARGATDTQDFLQSFLGRISALSTATAAVVDSDDAFTVTVDRLVARQLEPAILTFSERLQINGPPLRVSAPAAQQLSLVLHELATNAQKHGALAGDAGRVRVGWRLDGPASAPDFVLDWREEGGEAGAGNVISGGFGSALILKIAPETLGGRAEASLSGDFRYVLTVPMDRLRPPAESGDEAEDLARRLVDVAWGLGAEARA